MGEGGTVVNAPDRHIRTRWPASGSRKPQPHFLAIRWDATAEDGTPVTLQATLCKAHRQVIALTSSSAQGVRRQFGESCDLCDGRKPTPLPHRGE
jgi:hypothetical protein